MNDIEIMASEDIQKYYSGEYISYQRKVIERNEKFSEDNLMIKKLILELNITGVLADIGSGDCRWFPYFEQKMDHYYGIDINIAALSLAPINKKLTVINKNIFEDNIELFESPSFKIDIVLFSFFFSHFSDPTIQNLLAKIKKPKSILIIDSFWGAKHKEKYMTKELRNVKRMISQKDFIDLPKRFFEYSDLHHLANTLGYSIKKFDHGNYLFICILEQI